MAGKSRFDRETIQEWLLSLWVCRFEHPKIRRPLKILRYISMVIGFMIFALVLAVTLVLHFSALYPVTITTITFVIAEVIYYTVRAYLLRNLKMQMAKSA